MAPWVPLRSDNDVKKDLTWFTVSAWGTHFKCFTASSSYKMVADCWPGLLNTRNSEYILRKECSLRTFRIALFKPTLSGHSDLHLINIGLESYLSALKGNCCVDVAFHWLIRTCGGPWSVKTSPVAWRGPSRMKWLAVTRTHFNKRLMYFGVTMASYAKLRWTLRMRNSIKASQLTRQNIEHSSKVSRSQFEQSPEHLSWP
jgi:hypothetical protein